MGKAKGRQIGEAAVHTTTELPSVHELLTVDHTGCAPDWWGGRSGYKISSSPTLQNGTESAPGPLLASGCAATGQ